MTKELKKVNKYFYLIGFFSIWFIFFNQIFPKNIQVLGGSKFEDFVKNNLVDVSNIKVRSVLHFDYFRKISQFYMYVNIYIWRTTSC